MCRVNSLCASYCVGEDWTCAVFPVVWPGFSGVAWIKKRRDVTRRSTPGNSGSHNAAELKYESLHECH